jgi:hypothetical protein
MPVIRWNACLVAICKLLYCMCIAEIHEILWSRGWGNFWIDRKYVREVFRRAPIALRPDPLNLFYPPYFSMVNVHNFVFAIYPLVLVCFCDWCGLNCCGKPLFRKPLLKSRLSNRCSAGRSLNPLACNNLCKPLRRCVTTSIFSVKWNAKIPLCFLKKKVGSQTR